MNEEEPFGPVPIWAFHGGLDEVVLCDSVIEVMKSLRHRFPESES